MSGKEHVAKLFDENFSVAEVGVVEGVMGLFDGYDCKRVVLPTWHPCFGCPSFWS